MKHLLYLPKNAAWLAALLLAGHAALAQFGPATRLPMGAGSRPYDLKLADFNGDGRPDAVTANARTHTVGVLLNTTAAGAATLSFGPVSAFSTGAGSTPNEVAAADFNGDGRPDVAVRNKSTSQVLVLRNTTAAGAAAVSFAAPAAFASPPSSSLTAGDVNNDGRPDLVVTSPNLASTGLTDVLGFLLNTTPAGAATVSFAPVSTLAVAGTYPVATTLADLNGDGKNDLLVSNAYLGTVSALLNTTAAGAAAPSFAPATTVPITSAGEYIGLAVGDVNGDNRPDLAATSFVSGGVRVLLNTTAQGAGTASFGAATTLAATPNGKPFQVQLVDLNGDNRRDVVTANFYDSTVGVLLNTTAVGAPTASFASGRTFTASDYYYSLYSVAVADLNGDGRPDVVGASSRANTIGALRNTMAAGATTASFDPVGLFSTGAGAFPIAVAAADLNADGRPEALTASAGLDAVGLLPNNTPAGAATPTLGAVLNLEAGAGSSPEAVAAADLNGDSRPDVVSANLSSVTVWLNTTAAGATTFSFAPVAAFALAADNDPYGLELADVNGDGKPDILVVSLGTEEVSILLNTTAAGATTASFAARVSLPAPAGSQPVALAAGDVNSDGKPDVAVAASGTSELLLWRNTTATGATTPSFAAPVSVPAGAGSFPYSVALVDVNGDGKRDLAFIDNDQSTAGLLLNTTAAGAATVSFGPLASFTTGALSYPNALAAGDVNHDGRPDLLATLSGAAGVAVLLNTTAAGAATASYGPATTYPTGDGTTPLNLVVADLNGDSRPEVLAASYDSDELLLLPNQYVLAAATQRPSPIGVQAYPNPSPGRLTLHRPAPAAPTPATLYDAQGRTLRTLPLPTADTELDLSDLPAGLYLLRLAVDGQPVSLRLTRQ